MNFCTTVRDINEAQDKLHKKLKGRVLGPQQYYEVLLYGLTLLFRAIYSGNREEGRKSVLKLAAVCAEWLDNFDTPPRDPTKETKNKDESEDIKGMVDTIDLGFLKVLVFDNAEDMERYAQAANAAEHTVPIGNARKASA